MKISDKAVWSVAHNIKNISFCCIAIHGRKLCNPDNVLLFFFASMNTMPNDLDHTFRQSEVHNYKESKYNEQCLS